VDPHRRALATEPAWNSALELSKSDDGSSRTGVGSPTRRSQERSDQQSRAVGGGRVGSKPKTFHCGLFWAGRARREENEYRWKFEESSIVGHLPLVAVSN
jgi:hypothetical protein